MMATRQVLKSMAAFVSESSDTDKFENFLKENQQRVRSRCWFLLIFHIIKVELAIPPTEFHSKLHRKVQD